MAVRARRRIEQSPLSDAQAVPTGACGSVEDEADGYLFVDFGEPHGVVMCEREEVVRD